MPVRWSIPAGPQAHALLHASQVVIRDDDEVDRRAAVDVFGALAPSRACTAAQGAATQEK